MKKETIILTIKASDIKVSTGHKCSDQGCGRHDNRPKRLRTRQSIRRQILKSYDPNIS
jgi:hypothetical protein